jgi:hypothetical protein
MTKMMTTDKTSELAKNAPAHLAILQITSELNFDVSIAA